MSALSLRQRCRPSPWMSDSSPSWPLVQRSTFGILAFRWLSRQPLPAENTSSSSSATVGVWLAPQLCGVRQTLTTLLKARLSANAEMPLRSTTSFAAKYFGAPALSRLKAVISVIPKKRTTSTPCGRLNKPLTWGPCGSFFFLFFLHFQKEPKRNQRNAGPFCSFSFEKEPKKTFSFRKRIIFFSLSKRSKRNKQSCLIRLLSAVRKKQRTVLWKEPNLKSHNKTDLV